MVEQDEYILVDGLHAPIVSEIVWKKEQVKLATQAKKYGQVNKSVDKRTYLLSGIVNCPICGAGMYGKTVVCLLRTAGTIVAE